MSVQDRQAETGAVTVGLWPGIRPEGQGVEESVSTV